MNIKNLLGLMVLICLSQIAPAQCTLKEINTNWDPIYTLPSGTTHQTNTFDWTQKFWPMDKPDIGVYNTTVFSPFWSSDIYMQDIASPSIAANRDYAPEDGWELIKQGLGYIHDNGTTPAWQGPINGAFLDKRIPYAIMYNKYDAKLRIFGMDDKLGAFSKMRISLTYFNPSNGNKYGSALFNTYNGVQDATDRPTKRNKIAAAATFIDQRWFYADFTMAYDPCLCFFESDFEIDFHYIETAEFLASARLIGINYSKEEMLKVNATSNDLYGDNIPSSEDFATSFMQGTSGEIANEVMLQHYKEVNQLLDKLGNNDNKNGIDYTAAKDALKALALLTKGAQLAGAKGVAVEKAVKGLSYALDGLNFFSAFDNGKDKTKVQPSAISVNGIVSGAMTNIVPSGSGFILATPGSLNADVRPEYGYSVNADVPSYPMYNNALGLLTLTRTPKVAFVTTHKITGVTGNAITGIVISNPSLAVGSYSLKELEKL
jgi:hypothetical protein